jgi:hypothetical protein
MMDTDDLNALGRKIRRALKTAGKPLALDEIAGRVGASRYDVHDAISISLHGWIEILPGSRYKLL